MQTKSACGANFSTSSGELFTISISDESDWSVDGGHSFKEVKNSFELDLLDAKTLISELERFVNKGT